MNTHHSHRLTILKDLLDACLEHLQSLHHRPTTLRSITYNVKAFLIWLQQTYEITTVDRLRADHLHHWQTYLHNYRKTDGMPLKPLSVNKKIENIRTYLVYLHKSHLIPAALTQVLAYVKTPKLLPRTLPHSEIRTLLKSIDTTTSAGYRNRALLELMYSSALRADEALSLNIADVDMTTGTAIIHGKGDKERLVPIGTTALRYLKTYIRGVRPFQLYHRHEMALFIDYKGRRMAYHILRRMILKVADQAGMAGKLTAHVLRRSCTSELVKGNANLYHVSRFLGHESLKTLNPYVKLDLTDIRKTHRKTHPREQDERREH